jgi:CRP-like cAMP-binding protein
MRPQKVDQVNTFEVTTPRGRTELAIGQEKLTAIVRNSPQCTLKTGELLGAANDWSDGVYHLREGSACEFCDFANARRAIVYAYLPGDVIGLDSVSQARPLEDVWTSTSAAVEAIPAEDALVEVMGDRQTALYVTWLLGRRQRRADRPRSQALMRGRLAVVMLDFYTRLRRRKLTTGSIYNLPLTQVQIGHHLGLTVVHINRVLRSLRDKRIVDLEEHRLDDPRSGGAHESGPERGNSKFVECEHRRALFNRNRDPGAQWDRMTHDVDGSGCSRPPGFPRLVTRSVEAGERVRAPRAGRLSTANC